MAAAVASDEDVEWRPPSPAGEDRNLSGRPLYDGADRTWRPPSPAGEDRSQVTVAGRGR